MTDFSRKLIECREAAGFKTPHEFYRKSGGAKVLRVSFVSFWRMEKGTLLPAAERLPILLSCLRLPVEGAKTDELLRAYLKALLRSDTAYEWLMARLAPPAVAASSMQDVAVRRALAEDYTPLSREQFAAIVSDYAAYWAHHFLEHDQRAWDVAKLAGRLRVKVAEVRRSLKRLAAVKLVALEADGRVRSLVAGKYMRLPAADVTPAADKERVVGYRERMLAEQGTRLWRRTVDLRAYEPELAAYFAHLGQAVQAAHVFSVSGKPGEEKPGPTAKYLVQAQVFRLFPY